MTDYSLSPEFLLAIRFEREWEEARAARQEREARKIEHAASDFQGEEEA